MEDLSRLRTEIRALQKERFKIEISLFRPFSMVPYSLITAYFPCGKPGCRCKKGKRYFHGPYFYLSQHRAGKTRNIYINQKELARVRVLADRYKGYESSLTRIRRINQEILFLLKKIEEQSFLSEDKIVRYGKERKRRKG